jgi:Zn-dependent protease with chaperone function
MSPSLAALALAATAVACLGPLSVRLERARWTWRAPRAAVALWQSIGLAGGLSAIGAGLSVAVVRFHAGFLPGLVDLVHGLSGGHPLAGIGLPNALGLTLAFDIAAVMTCLAVTSAVRTIRARAHHRRLLDLVSVGTDRAPGAVLLNHPRAAAYYLPGLRPRIVVSAGTLRLLRRPELAAVLEHERGHAQEHHGLVLLPLTSFGELVRWIPYARRAPRSVAGLLEMAADDYAARQHDPRHLASALLRMTTSGAPPACTFGAASTAVPSRVRRLLDPRRRSRPIALAACLGAALALAVPALVVVAA